MFEIVFVCTGNRNRSPLAEAALRNALEGLPVKVRSLGLMDLGSVSVLPETLEVARRFGLDVSGHRSRCIAGADISDADLVLGFELSHAAAAVVDHGAPPDRTFTLLEFARLGKTLPEPSEQASDPGSIVAQAYQLRKSRSVVPAGVGDPFGGTASGFTHMGETIVAACNELAEILFGRSRI